MSSVRSMQIETERLMLRTMSPDDVTEDYCGWLNDPAVNKYLSCEKVRHTKGSCRDYVRSYLERADAALIGIFLKENHLHIGNITLSSLNWKDRIATVGISIGRKELWGQGYGCEALSTVIEYCFATLDMHRVQAGVSESNVSSLKLFLKCGLRQEGVLRENHRINGKLENSFILGRLRTDSFE